MAHYNRDDYGPSSSPGSSPALTAADSSPFSSPVLGSLQLDSEVDELPAFSDPFAGSYKHRPTKRLKGEDSKSSIASSTFETRDQRVAEDLIWANEAERAYEEGRRIFHLGKKDLTRINKQFIRDLTSMVVIPNLDTPRCETSSSKPQLRQIPSAPSVAARQVRRTFSRNESKNSVLLPGEKDENIHLYLEQNLITKIPIELWRLENLTILSLRNNRIAYLPPEIGKLRRLRDLNISTNMFKYLPAELNNLRLESLNVFPNRYFIEPPKPDQKVSAPEYSSTESPVPSLIELALRVLGSPSSLAKQAKHQSTATESEPPPQMVLEDCLPLAMETLEDFSGPLRRILDAIYPGCVPQSMLEETEDGDESTQIAGIARCGNPEHESWFVRHVEERYTWVGVVAGKIVGGAVPLRWRGCSRGCLSFLDAVAIDDGGKNKGGDDEIVFEEITGLGGELTFGDGDD